jgi:hypothetical protein
LGADAVPALAEEQNLLEVVLLGFGEMDPIASAGGCSTLAGHDFRIA